MLGYNSDELLQLAVSEIQLSGATTKPILSV